MTLSGCVPAIMLGSIKVPYVEIRRRVLKCEPQTLTADTLEQLLRNLPDEEHMKEIAKLGDEYDELDEAEKFVFVVRKPLNSRYCSEHMVGATRARGRRSLQVFF